MLFGIAAFPLFYALGNLLAKRAGAIAFGVFFALSQYHIFYSQDGNPYSETMFYTVAAIYLAASGLAQKRYWVVALSFLPVILSFLTHPFSGLFGGFLALSILAVKFAQSDKQRLVNALAIWRHSRKRIILEVIALAILIPMPFLTLWFMYTHSQYGLFNIFWQMVYSRAIRPGAMAWNMEFSPYFFARTLRELGPSYIFDNILVQAASLLFFIFWLAGLVATLRQRRWLNLFLYIPIIGTYVFLFNFDPGRFFHIRYASYLAPLYLAAVAIGGIDIAAFLRKRIPAAVGERRILADLWPVLLVAALTLPSLAAYYFRDGENWRKVARYLAPRLTEKKQPHLLQRARGPAGALLCQAIGISSILDHRAAKHPAESATIGIGAAQERRRNQSRQLVLHLLDRSRPTGRHDASLFAPHHGMGQPKLSEDHRRALRGRGQSHPRLQGKPPRRLRQEPPRPIRRALSLALPPQVSLRALLSSH